MIALRNAMQKTHILLKTIKFKAKLQITPFNFNIFGHEAYNSNGWHFLVFSNETSRFQSSNPPHPFFFALICFELSSVVLFHPILSLVKRHHFSALNCVDWLERLYFGDNWKLND